LASPRLLTVFTCTLGRRKIGKHISSRRTEKSAKFQRLTLRLDKFVFLQHVMYLYHQSTTYLCLLEFRLCTCPAALISIRRNPGMMIFLSLRLLCIGTLYTEAYSLYIYIYRYLRTHKLGLKSWVTFGKC
jgi:hypothetical protein